MADEQRGLVLVTGANRLREDDDARRDRSTHQPDAPQHIVTIEDPIEILHDDHGCIVNQREVGSTPSRSAGAARALRQDPDVILIGELRDAETAQTALQAAESGTSCSRRCTRSTPPRRSAG
jgi:twitching motility protein PilT